MTTLITMGKGGIPDFRRCDAKCHNAKGSECNCICEGALHGKGEKAALEILREKYGFMLNEPEGAVVYLQTQREFEFTKVIK